MSILQLLEVHQSKDQGNHFLREMLPVANHAVQMAWERVMSPAPTTVEDLEEMLERKITYITRVYNEAEKKERRYMAISGLLVLIGMVILVAGTSLQSAILGFASVLVGAIALMVADFYRSVKEQEPPQGIVKSHSETIAIIARLQLSEEQRTCIDIRMEQLNNAIPCGWQ